jgi:hypothetical protein
VKIPYDSKTLLLNVLFVLTILGEIWAKEKNLLTLEWILGIALLVQVIFRWPWTGPRF